MRALSQICKRAERTGWRGAMAVGRSLDLQPLNPLDFHISQIWRHRIHHGYHSNVAPWSQQLAVVVPARVFVRSCQVGWSGHAPQTLRVVGEVDTVCHLFPNVPHHLRYRRLPRCHLVHLDPDDVRQMRITFERRLKSTLAPYRTYLRHF